MHQSEYQCSGTHAPCSWTHAEEKDEKKSTLKTTETPRTAAALVSDILACSTDAFCATCGIKFVHQKKIKCHNKRLSTCRLRLCLSSLHFSRRNCPYPHAVMQRVIWWKTLHEGDAQPTLAMWGTLIKCMLMRTCAVSSAAVVPRAKSSVPSGESRRAKRLALLAILGSLSSVTRMSSWIWAGTRNDCIQQNKVKTYTLHVHR